MFKFLIDECLSTTLARVACEAGHEADHVVWMGWSSMPDYDLMPIIEQRDYTFVTNNRADFLRLHGRSELHCGLLIIVTSVDREGQVALFEWALTHLRTVPDLINKVVEILVGPVIVTRDLAAPTR